MELVKAVRIGSKGSGGGWEHPGTNAYKWRNFEWNALPILGNDPAEVEGVFVPINEYQAALRERGIWSFRNKGKIRGMRVEGGYIFWRVF